MSVGLPGTGIGGLFYIAGALWMPVQEGWRTVRRHPGPRRWRAAGLQAGMALSIIAGIWAAGWLLGLLLIPDAVAGAGPGGGAAGAATRGVFELVALFGTLGILATVLGSVQLLRLVVRRAPQPAPGEPLREAA